MANSYDTYTGDGSTKNFSITFPYLMHDHIAVYVDGVLTGFKFKGDSTVRVTPAPEGGSTVQIRRETPDENPLVDWANGTTLTARTLDVLAKQAIYAVVEKTRNVLGLSYKGHFDAKGLRIENLKEPEYDEDAVTKGWVINREEGTENRAAASAARAEAAAQASGNITFFDDKADADAASSGLANGSVVEVFNDETRGNLRTRYRVESGSLVYKLQFTNPFIRFSDAAEMVANSSLTYANSGAVAGDKWLVGDTTFIVAEAGVKNVELTTAGGVEVNIASNIRDTTQGVKALGGAIDGVTSAWTELIRFLRASKYRWGDVVNVDTRIDLEDGWSIENIDIKGDMAGPLVIAKTDASDVVFSRASVQNLNTAGMAMMINVPGVNNIRMYDSDFISDSYAVLLNEDAAGFSSFQSVGNRIYTSRADGHEWNFPDVNANYLISMGDIISGGLAGSGGTAGFAYGNANAKTWSIVGGIIKGSRRDAIHIEDGQRRGVVGLVAIDNAMEDGIWMSGPRDYELDSTGGFDEAKEVQFDTGTGPQTAYVHQITNNVMTLIDVSTEEHDKLPKPGDTISQSSTGASATVIGVYAQGEADGVPVVGVSATHKGTRTGYSGYNAIYQPKYAPLRGSSLIGAFFRGFQRGVTVSERAWVFLSGVSVAGADHVLNVGKSATALGHLHCLSKGVALFRGNNRGIGGFISSDEHHTKIVDFVGGGTQPGTTVEGFLMRFRLQHNGGNSSQNMDICDLPKTMNGQLTVFTESAGKWAWTSAWVKYDGVGFTVSHKCIAHYGSISSSDFVAEGGKLKYRFYDSTGVACEAKVLFRGVWMENS